MMISAAIARPVCPIRLGPRLRRRWGGRQAERTGGRAAGPARAFGCCPRIVASGILPDVEGGVPPARTLRRALFRRAGRPALRQARRLPLLICIVACRGNGAQGEDFREPIPSLVPLTNSGTSEPGAPY